MKKTTMVAGLIASLLLIMTLVAGTDAVNSISKTLGWHGGILTMLICTGVPMFLLATQKIRPDDEDLFFVGISLGLIGGTVIDPIFGLVLCLNVILLYLGKWLFCPKTRRKFEDWLFSLNPNF